MKRRKQLAKNKVTPPREYDENLEVITSLIVQKQFIQFFFLYFHSTEENGKYKKGIEEKARKEQKKLKTYKKLCKRERET